MMPPAGAAALAVPAAFVLLWSSGFVGAKLGLPYAGPLTFLSLRFASVLALMLPLALLLHARWPSSRADALHIAVAGVLIQGGYLGGVFSAISLGMSAGVVALIVGMQPLITAMLAGRMLGERLSLRQWCGIALGLLGVALVVWEKLSLRGLTAASLLLAFGALVCITYGTLYQKRHCPKFDLRSGSVIQFAAALLVVLPFALATEDMRVEWSGEFVFALAWLVVVLSVGATTLLFMLIARGAATRVSSLFYLTPPITALMAWMMFDETLSPTALAGMAAACSGFAMINSKRAAA